MTRTPLRALVVEDDGNVVDFIRRTMVVLGHDCVCATNVQDAREALRKGDFHYVLLDLKIPAMPDGLFPNIDSGMTFLAEIGKERGNGRTPIFVMTSHTDQGFGMAVKLTQMGASHCIPKPLDDKPLSQIIQEVLADHSRRSLLDGKTSQPVSQEPQPKQPKTVDLQAQSTECYGELEAVKGGRGLLRIFSMRKGPGKRPELCDPIGLDKQAFSILVGGVENSRSRFIEKKAGQAEADGKHLGRSECEPPDEYSHNIVWDRNELAVILHNKDDYGSLTREQKNTIKTAMGRVRKLARFKDVSQLVSEADKDGHRCLAIRLRFRKSGQA